MRKQRGYLMVEVGLAILVASAMVMMLYRQQARRERIEQDAGNGQELVQFVVGLRGFIAAAQSNPGIIPGTAQTGVNWLKPPACGGLATNPAQGYVPCSYTGGRYGSLLSTTITRNAATNFIEARSSFFVPATSPDRVVRAERIAQAARAAAATAPGGVFFAAYANVPTTANGPVNPAAMAAADRGRVLMIASNAPSNDIYLRTDGTNKMLANLNLGGFSLANALDARFSGDVRIQGRAQIDTGMTVVGAADMQGGIVTNEIALTSINHYVTEGIYDAKVYSGAASYNIPKPNCAQAGNNPGIYAALQSTGDPNAGGYVADAVYQARVDVNDTGASWTVIPRLYATRIDMAMNGSNLQMTKTVVPGDTTAMKVLIMTRCR